MIKSIIVKIFVSFFLFISISEMVSRLLITPPRLISFVVDDDLLGHKGPPGATVLIGKGPLKYSEYGFRKLSLPKQKDEKNHQKVLWIGDSMIEQISIEDKDHFSYLLSDKLSIAANILAIGDWGTTQELLAFKEYVSIYQPNLTVLFFSSLTDFVNNNSNFAGRYQSRVDFLRPYAEVTENNSIHYFYLRPYYRLLRRYSHMFRVYDNAQIAKSLSSHELLPIGSCEKNENFVPLGVYFTNQDEEWKRSIEITSALFKELRREALKNNSRLLIVYLPNDIELLDTKWTEIVTNALGSCFVGKETSKREAERKFFESVRMAGVEAFSLYDFFALKIAKGENVFLDDGHLNERGNQLLAEVLEVELSKRYVFDVK
ncbi:MAG: hypothetical protein M9962_10845 [Oligoflexia bacterium]|nr:hypothetical protein [Oligoflexia bacterium]